MHSVAARRARRVPALALIVTAALVAAAVPTPESHFGHRMGGDRKVLDWDHVVSYFRALEKTSGRVRVEELGKSTEGRPFIAATIAAPTTLNELGRYRTAIRRLADPRRTPPSQAERLIADGKAVVMITCSIHATEVGSTQAAVELAYRLATDESPRTRRILGNTIVLLVPSLNPDGLDLVTAWYRKTLGSQWEGQAPPALYQKYAGHDNNRDWYFFSQAETRLTVAKLYRVWHPQIVYDVHEQEPYASRMFVPPWMDPINPNLDPVLVADANRIGATVAADLAGAGKSGAVIHALYDCWSPSRDYAGYHEGIRILSEAASVRIATPLLVPPQRIDSKARGYNPRERSWNYPQPWLGGEWHLRDIVDYELIAMQSVLRQASERRSDVLRNFYNAGRHSIERKKPFAYVIPAEQHDAGAARKLLDTLGFGDVEVERAVAPFTAAGESFKAGSYVVRMAQPSSAFAKAVLERQSFPPQYEYRGGPPVKPYDTAAHTLPLLLGVRVIEAGEAFDARVETERDYHFARNAEAGMLPAADSTSWREINRIWASGGMVWRDAGTGDFHTASGRTRWLNTVPRPRIAVYRGAVPNPDEGWTRWVLDQFGFAYTSAGNSDIKAGGLRTRFDALVFPDQSPSAIEIGYRAGEMPPEYTGGIGEEGLRAVRRFAEDGGTALFFDGAAEYAIHALGLELQSAVATLGSAEYYSPGSLLNAVTDSRSPLAYGLPRDITIWNQGSPVWEIPANGTARAVVRYPESGLLASGWLIGDKYLAGKAAVIEYPLGRGRIVLYGMRPQYRGQSWGTFKLFFNALLAAD